MKMVELAMDDIDVGLQNPLRRFKCTKYNGSEQDAWYAGPMIDSTTATMKS